MCNIYNIYIYIYIYRQYCYRQRPNFWRFNTVYGVKTKQSKTEGEKWNEEYIKGKLRNKRKTGKRMRNGMKEVVREEESKLLEWCNLPKTPCNVTVWHLGTTKRNRISCLVSWWQQFRLNYCRFSTAIVRCVAKLFTIYINNRRI